MHALGRSLEELGAQARHLLEGEPQGERFVWAFERLVEDMVRPNPWERITLAKAVARVEKMRGVFGW